MKASEYTPSLGRMSHLALERLTERLDKVVDDALSQGKVVGTSVKVFYDGSVVYQRVAGLNERSDNVPMQANALFRWASLSKLVTSMLCLIAAERGLLRLDDAVTKWLPEFRPKLNGEARVIKIHQLLSHTSGLAYPFFDDKGSYERNAVPNGLDSPGVGMDEALKRLSDAGLVFEPGSQWLYSLSLDVAGAVLEKAIGSELPTIFSDYLAKPLGLETAGFTAGNLDDLAKPYVREPNGEIVEMQAHHIVEFPGPFHIPMCPDRMLDPASFASGGAGMIGSIDDYSKLLEAIRGGLAGLSSETSKSYLFDNQIGDIPTMLGAGWGHTLGAAVVVDRDQAESPLPNGSLVWSGAYGHSWMIDPVNNISMVIMTNTTPEGDWGSYPCDFRDALYSLFQAD